MKYIILSLFLAGPLWAQAPQTAFPATTVLRVNNEAVTSARVYTALDQKTQAKLSEWATQYDFVTFYAKVKEILGMKTGEIIREQLFYQFAYQDLEKTDNFEDILKKSDEFHLRRLLAQYDANEARAQRELQARGSSIKDKLEDDKRQFIVRSYWEKHYQPTTELTPTQMQQYYRNHLKEKYQKPASLQFQLIEIQVNPNGAAASAEDVKAAHEAAASAAHGALAELKTGADFAAVVRKYSNGFRKENDGIWPAYDPAGLQEQYQPIVEPLKKLTPGQHTGVIETPDRFFIARLIEFQDASVTPFAEVQDKIAAILKNEIQARHMYKLTEKLIAKATVGNMETFLRETAQAIYDFLRQNPVKTVNETLKDAEGH